MCGLGAGSGLAEELDMDPPRLRGIKMRDRRALRIPVSQLTKILRIYVYADDL